MAEQAELDDKMKARMAIIDRLIERSNITVVSSPHQNNIAGTPANYGPPATMQERLAIIDRLIERSNITVVSSPHQNNIAGTPANYGPPATAASSPYQNNKIGTLANDDSAAASPPSRDMPPATSLPRSRLPLPTRPDAGKSIGPQQPAKQPLPSSSGRASPRSAHTGHVAAATGPAPATPSPQAVGKANVELGQTSRPRTTAEPTSYGVPATTGNRDGADGEDIWRRD